MCVLLEQGIREDRGTGLREQGNKAWGLPAVTRQICLRYAAGLTFAFQKRKCFTKLGRQHGIISDKGGKKIKRRRKKRKTKK